MPKPRIRAHLPPRGLLWGPVFQEFVKMTNYDVEHTIKKEMSGDVRDVFVAIGNWWGPRARAGEGQEACPESLDECGLCNFLNY